MRRWKPVLAVTGTLIAAALAFAEPARAAAPYQDPSLPVATRVDDLLGRMSLDEKLGQMTQAERASISAAEVTQYRLGCSSPAAARRRRPTPRPGGPTCTTASSAAPWPRRWASR